MKIRQASFLLAATFVGGLLSASAQLTIPSDGSDGALNITEDTVIDLSQATDGAWDSPGSGNGVYDPDQWAVVFKYSSVNIASGATVTFTNHRTYAPVVWLVQGNVTINGILNLNGQNGAATLPEILIPTEPGPGGFRGGAGGPSGWGAGYGPGGGDPTWMGSARGHYLGVYGNPQIVPLIGGSGAGSNTDYWHAAAAGGGAILIAASGTVTISGNIQARGGYRDYGIYGEHGGSGGAVRIIAEAVTGAGNIDAKGGGVKAPDNSGRIRIEANSLAPSLVTAPETIRVAPASPPIIWPAANAPKARVVSVDAQNAPLDPTSPLVADADVAIQNNSPVDILIETRDFPIEGVVQLRVTPKFGGHSWHNATRVSGDITQATWKVTTTLPQGFVVLQARATQP